MVRIISQNFSPQRSRHNSGETDTYLSERTNSALGISAVTKKRFENVERESSSDSFWDSEIDQDVEQHDGAQSEQGADNDINGNETLNKSNVQTKRKERRRERNKVSAQAYRQRRRSQSMKDQELLTQLEAKNRELHTIVETLERKTEQTKQFLRGCSVPKPDFFSALPAPPPDEVCEGATAGVTAKSESTSASSHIPDPLVPSHQTRHSPLQNAGCSPHSTPSYAHDTHTSPRRPYIKSHTNTNAFNTVALESPGNASITFQNIPEQGAPVTETSKFISAKVNLNNGNYLSHTPHSITHNADTNANNNNSEANPRPPCIPKDIFQPPTNILINSNTFIQQTPLQQMSNAPSIPCYAVPAFVAIPVNSNSVAINQNLVRKSTDSNRVAEISSLSPCVSSSVHSQENGNVTNGNTGTPLLGTFMLKLNGNSSPASAPVYSFMNFEMCKMNNNLDKNVNINKISCNINDPANTRPANANINTNHNNFNFNNATPSSPVTVNLNDIKVTGEPLQVWAAPCQP